MSQTKRMQRARERSGKGSEAAEDRAGTTNVAPPAPEPKRLVVAVPVRKTKRGYDASRIVNGRFKQSYENDTLYDAITDALRQYLEQDWPENVDITVNMIVEKNKPEEELDDFLRELDDEETEASSTDTGSGTAGD